VTRPGTASVPTSAMTPHEAGEPVGSTHDPVREPERPAVNVATINVTAIRVLITSLISSLKSPRYPPPRAPAASSGLPLRLGQASLATLTRPPPGPAGTIGVPAEIVRLPPRRRAVCSRASAAVRSGSSAAMQRAATEACAANRRSARGPRRAVRIRPGGASWGVVSQRRPVRRVPR
jgi:hypothetical protein